MSTFIYISSQDMKESIMPYAKKHFKTAEVIVENSALMMDWNERTLNDVLVRAQKNDTIVAFDALNLARSHIQVLGFLQACLTKGVKVQFLKYDLTFTAASNIPFLELLSLSRAIENDFVSRRNQDAIAKRHEYGIVLGRPKGRKNRSLKLDKYKKDIMRYLELSISKASIAKLVDCHPQTLYDWIERNEIADSKPRRTRQARAKKAELV